MICSRLLIGDTAEIKKTLTGTVYAAHTVDDIREFIRSVNISSKSERIVILDDAQNLTVAAQNALLKTLEEPPENAIIILLATNLDLMLPTIISRCQVEILNFSKAVPPETHKILDLIKNKDIKAGFAWAKKNTDRQTALSQVDNLLFGAHQRLLQDQVLQTSIIHSLLETKKYLRANTNVRLTLENLFVAC